MESAKLKQLMKLHKKHWKLREVSRHILTIYDDRLNVDIMCIAPTRQNTDIYRVKYLDSGVVVNMNITKLHKAGNMFVKCWPRVITTKFQQLNN